MRKPLLSILLIFFAINTFAQNTVTHYIKFFHVGEKILPVHTLNISYIDGYVPRDTDEVILDTLRSVSILTDEATYNSILAYIQKTNFHFSKTPGQLSFGTFKILGEGKYYYLPDLSCTDYFKKLVVYLKKKKSDPQAIQGIIDNYPWIFNP
jgi:hypothetical protein